MDLVLLGLGRDPRPRPRPNRPPRPNLLPRPNRTKSTWYYLDPVTVFSGPGNEMCIYYYLLSFVWPRTVLIDRDVSSPSLFGNTLRGTAATNFLNFNVPSKIKYNDEFIKA